MKKNRIKSFVASFIALLGLTGCQKLDEGINNLLETNNITTSEDNYDTSVQNNEYVIEAPAVEEIKTYQGEYAYITNATTVLDENGNILYPIEKYQKVVVMCKYDLATLVLLENGICGFVMNNNIELLGNRFVEVDISDQKVTLYDNNEPLYTCDVITGNPNKGTTPGTNEGLSEIYYKCSPFHFECGLDSNYFMCINTDGEGFHDASWRSENEFTNKDTYLYNGSNGCINMKNIDAENLYSLTNVHDKVLVHK